MWLVVNSTMSAVLIYEPPQTARPPGNRIRLGTPVSWFGGWHWELEIGGGGSANADDRALGLEKCTH